MLHFVTHPLSLVIFLILQVNEKVVALPFLREPYVFVERRTNMVLLNTNIGLKVRQHGSSHSVNIFIKHNYTATSLPLGAVESSFTPGSECARFIQGPNLWSLWKLQQLSPG